MSARILILEPDDHARIALFELLTDEGYEVFSAAAAPDGLAELLVQFAPDLVLADAAQHTSCAPLVRAAAGAATPSAAPLVLMALDPDSRRGYANVLAKPIDVDTLLRTIAALLRARVP